MPRRLAKVLALGSLLAVLPASGAELVVQGQVVDVVPLRQPARGGQTPDCRPPQPPASAGLIELLAWDLRTDCPASPEPEAYRVFYRWDGRTYSRIMTSPPGDTVSLRVRLD